MANKDQFISAVTDEAMQRICYDENADGNGWKLTPLQFAISSTDPLEGYSDSQIWDDDGKVRPEIYEILHDFTTSMMKQDMDALTGGVWYESKFSGITPVNSGGSEEAGYESSATLTHHLVIPTNALPDGESRQIKTIYFIYVDANNNEPFLYALARASSYLGYESGVTQSFFFNFTVANTDEITNVKFDVKYSYPLELEDHNQHPLAHNNLVTRDGSRNITGLLKYSSSVSMASADDTTIPNKKYVDDQIVGISTEVSGQTKLYVTNSSGTRTKPDAITVVQQSGLPTGFVKQDGEYLMFTTPALPYIPYGQSTSGTSYTFVHGGMVLVPNSCAVTVFAGEPNSITFNNIVGVLPIMKGTRVTATRTVYFVDNA